jgi:hypothetical protein
LVVGGVDRGPRNLPWAHPRAQPWADIHQKQNISQQRKIQKGEALPSVNNAAEI